MPEKIDLDRLAIDCCLDDGGFWGVVVALWHEDLPAKRVGKLLCCFAISEIVDILRRVGTVFAEFGTIAIALSPKVERLTADDKGMIAKLRMLARS